MQELSKKIIIMTEDRLNYQATSDEGTVEKSGEERREAKRKVLGMHFKRDSGQRLSHTATTSRVKEIERGV